MEIVTLDEVVDKATKLPTTQRDMLLEILRGRQIEARRAEIAAAADEAPNAFRARDLIRRTAEGVIADLRQSLEEPE